VLREQPIAVELAIDGQRISDSVHGLYSRDGRLLQLVLRPGATTHKRGRAEIARYHTLVRPWVTQVCLAAVGLPITSVVCGPDDTLQIDALTRDEATAVLSSWIAVWREAWTRPLPVGGTSAVDFLAPVSGNHDAARDAFDGNGRRDGERARSAYLQRSFESYDDIQDELGLWAPRLYAELIARTRASDPP
jgi:exonuclease V gamma subunit